MSAPSHLDARRRPALTRARTAAALAAGLVPPLLTLAPAGPASAAVAPRENVYTQWDTGAELARGTLSGTRVAVGKIRLGAPTGRVQIGRTSYATGSWTSPWVRPRSDFNELIPSWTATTPEGTLVQVDVRAVSLGGTVGSWDTVARWAGGDGSYRRTSYGAQNDDVGRLATDTYLPSYGGFRSYQLRVTLLRRSGTGLTPTVGTVGAIASDLPHVDRVPTSRPVSRTPVLLDVPRYSQMIHAGEYPQYGGGGEAWCSPTSTTMVLAYYRKLPAASDYAWVNRSYTDRVVDHSARMTYDRGYGGTGNWPFNTAYAAGHAGKAFVTRLDSLRGVERLVRAGIPVVTSVTFGKGQLSGAPISATNGHLLVVVGFTASGDVVVNDPAARTRSGVRRTYDRAQFENAWLKRYPSGSSMRGSGGLAYVIRDAQHPLPAAGAGTSW